jgi:hypothetical protein
MTLAHCGINNDHQAFLPDNSQEGDAEGPWRQRVAEAYAMRQNPFHRVQVVSCVSWSPLCMSGCRCPIDGF